LLYSLIQHPGTQDMVTPDRRPLVPTSFTLEEVESDTNTCYAIRVGDLVYADGLPRNPESLGNKLRAIVLVRDGRNQIESQRKHKGSIDCERAVMNPKEWFEKACTGFKHRANYALRWASLPNVKLYKMENFIIQPYNTVLNMFNFLNLPIDKKALSQRVERLCRHRELVSTHSSFGTLQNINERWKTWTEWEIETFNRIAGKELRRLGYQ